MGIRDMIDNWKENNNRKKELISQMDETLRAEEILTARRKSANERELEMFQNEDREESIKLQLHKMRKIQADDTNFGHNPLNAPNITNHVDFEVLKQRNLFKEKSNMFNNKSILKGNHKLLKSHMRLMK